MLTAYRHSRSHSLSSRLYMSTDADHQIQFPRRWRWHRKRFHHKNHQLKVLERRLLKKVLWLLTLVQWHKCSSVLTCSIYLVILWHELSRQGCYCVGLMWRRVFVPYKKRESYYFILNIRPISAFRL